MKGIFEFLLVNSFKILLEGKNDFLREYFILKYKVLQIKKIFTFHFPSVPLKNATEFWEKILLWKMKLMTVTEKFKIFLM